MIVVPVAVVKVAVVTLGGFVSMMSGSTPWLSMLLVALTLALVLRHITTRQQGYSRS